MGDKNVPSSGASKQTHVDEVEVQIIKKKKQALDKRNRQVFQRQIHSDEAPHTSKHAPGRVEKIPLKKVPTSSKTSTDEPSHPENVDDVGLRQMARDGDLKMMITTIDQLDPSSVKQQVNMRGTYGRTPLHYAAKYKHIEMCKLLEEKGADINVRDVNDQTALHYLLDNESDDVQVGLRIELLKYLLDRGAPVAIKDVIGWTPLHYAAYSGHVACAKLMIEKYMVSNEEAGDFIDLKDKDERTSLHLACEGGHTEMVRFLLQWKADVTHRTLTGQNALDFAIDSENASCARVIIEDEKWREVLRNNSGESSFYYGVNATPMRKLIRKMPEIAEVVFTRCIESNNRPVDNEYYEVEFNYEFLDDEFACKNWSTGNKVDQVYDKWGHVVKSAVPYSSDPNLLKKNHPLNIMVEAKQKTLLRHPLVISLLSHRWRAYVRSVYYLNLLLYLMFMGIFNSYMLTMPPPYSIDSGNVTQSCVAIITEAQPTFESCYNYNSWGIVAKHFVIVLSAISLLKELYQVYSQRISYFLSFANLFEVSLYVSAILTVYSDTSSAGANYVGVREDWQWQVGAVSIFLSWMVLIMFMQNMPILGIYLLMFNHVLWTFMQFFMVFVFFILGFALTFHCLLQNQYAFRQWWVAVIKTSILMTGEFQFDEFFLSEVEAIESGADNHTITVSTVNYRPVSYILFIIFLVIMNIIIMNLLVGLTVDDIAGVQKNAEIEGLAMQVQLTLDVEYTLPQFIRRRLTRRYQMFCPNQYRQKSRFIQWWFSDKNLNHRTISEALNPQKNERDKIENQVEALDEKVESLNQKVESLDQKVESLDQKVESLDQKVESLKGMMSAIVSHFNIGGDKNDDDDDSNP